MDCPTCGYVMEPLDTTCRRCAQTPAGMHPPSPLGRARHSADPWPGRGTALVARIIMLVGLLLAITIFLPGILVHRRANQLEAQQNRPGSVPCPKCQGTGGVYGECDVCWGSGWESSSRVRDGAIGLGNWHLRYPYVEGLVHNKTDHTFRVIRAEFSILDGQGTQVGAVVAETLNLAPGVDWSFVVEVGLDLHVATVKFAALRTE